MAFTMAVWAADVYRTEAATLPRRWPPRSRGCSATSFFLFAAPVLVLLGWPLWENAMDGVRRGVFSTDLLLAAGVAASFVYSAVSVFRGDGPVYFEVGCVVLVMVTLGRWFEATGKLKANNALDRLARLMPDRVRRVGLAGEEDIPLAEVASGDVLRPARRAIPGRRDRPPRPGVCGRAGADGREYSQAPSGRPLSARDSFINKTTC